MSGATPADLAIAFRGLPRRLRDALDGCEDAASWAGHASVDALLAEAAALVGADSDALAIATAVESRHLDDWETADIERLQTIGLRLGALVRDAEAWREESPAD